jgi:hypothetical protein
VDDDLIGEYVATLRHRLAWRSDVDDIVDEVEDHLREHRDRLVAGGTDRLAAQRETLRRFGELGVVVGSFAEAAPGSLALPTRGTRAAGLAGVVAGVLWIAAVVSAGLGGFTDTLHPWAVTRYWVWAPCTVGALLLTAATLAGALARVGRLRTRTGSAALLVTGLVILALSAFTWAVLVVMVPAGLAVLVALRGHCGEAERIVRPLRLLAIWPLALGVQLFLAHVVRFGPLDEYGDRPSARFAAFVLAASISAVATAAVGRSLAGERPVDLSSPRPSSPAIAR